MSSCPVCGYDEEGRMERPVVSRAFVLISTDELARIATETRMAIERFEPTEQAIRFIELRDRAHAAEVACQELAGLAFNLLGAGGGARPVVSLADGDAG